DLRRDALAAIAARLRPGGTIVLNVQSQAESPVGRAYRARARLRRRPLNQLSHGGVVALLEDGGFRIDDEHWYGHAPRPGRFVGRAAARLDRPLRGLTRALRIPDRHVAQMLLVRATLVARPGAGHPGRPADAPTAVGQPVA